MADATVWAGVAGTAIMLALAGALLALGGARLANRAFALVLFLRGMAVLGATLAQSSASPATARYWWSVYPYFILPLAFAVVLFVAVYPRRRSWLGRWTVPALVVGMVALDAAYLLDHALYWNLDRVPAGVSPLSGAGAGPLFPFQDLWDVAYAFAALVLARDWTRAPEGRSRASLLLLSSAFGIVAATDAVGAAAVTGLGISHGAEGFPGRLFVLIVVPLVFLAAGLALVARRWGTPADRRAVLLYAGVLVVPSALVFGLVRAFAAGADVTGAFEFLNVVWRLALPLLATYALLRHKLFDLDLTVKWTIRRGTVAAAFVGVFFVATELAQNWLSDNYGWAVGGLAAGLLIFALPPLQAFAGRVADTALPDAKPVAEMTRAEKAALYRDQLNVAWSDGRLTPEERRLLDSLRDRLGLSADETLRLEREAVSA